LVRVGCLWRLEDLMLILSELLVTRPLLRDICVPVRCTGDSLCYAFIGFDSEAACEEAYFKMNNVLVDDRRIKVRPPARV